jgi:hypothetical protein
MRPAVVRYRHYIQDVTEWFDGRGDVVWPHGREPDAALLRTRRPKLLVHSAVRGCVFAGVGIWVFARRLAVRHRRGRMGASGGASVVKAKKRVGNGLGNWS